MSPLIIENVQKSYRQGDRQVAALRGVSLTVEQGQFLAIMGASGSGKSTLMHLIGGLTQPDSGRVIIDGRDIGQFNDRQLTKFRRERIGLVFQAFNLIPTLSAAENVRLPKLLERNGHGIEPRVQELLTSLGLADRQHHRPDALSGGEQQRVAIGRALINDPALILADEPTGNLDSANSRLVCELLQSLSRTSNRTIVMVTHEPTVAIYASSVAVLRDGLMVAHFPTAGMTVESLTLRYQEATQAGVA